MDFMYHLEYQGIGIGSRLLQWAKDNSLGRLSLFTFERNDGDRKFYEGPRLQTRGARVREAVAIADMKYEWNRKSDYRLSCLPTML